MTASYIAQSVTSAAAKKQMNFAACLKEGYQQTLGLQTGGKGQVSVSQFFMENTYHWEILNFWGALVIIVAIFHVRSRRLFSRQNPNWQEC